MVYILIVFLYKNEVIMKKQYRKNRLKKIFAVFCILGVGVSVFLFSRQLIEINEKPVNFNNKSQPLNSLKNNETISQKSILDSLQTLKLAYETVIVEKNSLSQQLETEKKNVENLMEIIKASKNPSASEIEVYRRQFSNLKATLKSKISEINTLKSQNKNLLTEVENQNVVMYKQKIENDTLILRQKKLETTLKDASRLTLNNFKVIALKESNSGKESETTKARNTQKLKISFGVLGNTIAKQGKKTFYIQVLDQKNKVLGEDKLIEFGNDKALVYSFIVAVDFQGKPTNAYGVLNAYELPFQKGTYFINFFDKQDLVGSTSITLK